MVVYNGLQHLIIKTLFLNIQGCADVAMVETTGWQEPYSVATESDETLQYHIYIESACLLSVHTLGDALANLLLCI